MTKNSELKEEFQRLKQNRIKELEQVKQLYNEKISDLVQKAKKQVVNYQFSDKIQNEFDKFSKEVSATNSFTVLNPLYGYENMKKGKYMKGAFAGGQFNVYKDHDENKWKIDYDQYNTYLNKCNSIDDYENDKKVNNCIRAISDDLQILQYIEKMAKKNPKSLNKLLEY
jgi:hypothetical protein